MKKLIFTKPIRKFSNCVFIGFLFLLTQPCLAGVIDYKLTFEVDTVSFLDDSTGAFDSSSLLGKKYFGYYSIDDSILDSDGLNLIGDLLEFNIEMEDTYWDMNMPFPESDFSGFRAGAPIGLGATSPGFDVIDGEIVNLQGGVYGTADFPFVDFSLFGDNTFNALFFVNKFEGPATTIIAGVQGSMGVTKVDEPSVVLLMVSGLVSLCVAGQKKNKT